MSSFQNTKGTSEMLFEKYWHFYRISDEKRIKSFYYLISIVFVTFILLINSNNSEEIIFLGMVIKRESALYIFPTLIFILSLRYFFLSALSLDNHYKFSKFFEGYKSISEVELDKNELCSPTILNSKYTVNEFKSDDVNELPNMFLFPVQLDNSGHINSVIRELFKPIVSLAFLALHLVPLGAYIYLYISNEDIILEFYLLFLILSLLVAITYFFIKTLHVQKYFKEKQLEFRALRREKEEDKDEQKRQKDEEKKRGQKMKENMEFMETPRGQLISWFIILIALIILLYFTVII